MLSCGLPVPDETDDAMPYDPKAVMQPFHEGIRHVGRFRGKIVT